MPGEDTDSPGVVARGDILALNWAIASADFSYKERLVPFDLLFLPVSPPRHMETATDFNIWTVEAPWAVGLLP